MNKTKIIATIGPATSSKEMLKKIILAGANVCRINFSHGTHDDHLQVINSVRELNTDLGIHTAILADLQGPKLRVGIVAEGSKLVKGRKLVFTTKECEGSSERVFMTYSAFPNDVAKGDKILIDDGKLVLKALSSNKKDEVVAEVLQGGPLSSNKGVNLPNTSISLPCLTKKDLVDLDFALDHKIAWIGLSFVRSARDIIEIKEIIAGSGERSLVVAKIEKPQAVADIDAIIQETDAIMVARGDLGVEVPMHEVPLIQKRIVEKSRKSAKPVIIATQMMETMIDSLTPTRAEVNDVANAVMDGADAVMLSAETSVGDNPIEVIDIMARIINEVETNYSNLFNQEAAPTENHARFITDSVCFNACRLAKRVQAKAIITMTHSGYTAFKISSQRPKSSIFVFSSNRNLLSCLSLVWGVKTFYYNKMVSTDNTIADIKIFLRENGLVSKGDLIINTASMPIEEAGKTNMLKLSEID